MAWYEVFASIMLLGSTWVGVEAFFTSLIPTHATAASLMRLYAEGGPPPYTKQMGTIRDAEVVGNGSVLLHIERLAPNNNNDDNSNNIDDDMKEELPPPPLEYEPGHVLALEIQGDSNAPDVDEKTRRDMEQNDGWMRGPYTVTRCNPKDSSLDILIKVVGAKSKVLATSPPGTPVRFGGKFHVPIVRELESVPVSGQSNNCCRRRSLMGRLISLHVTGTTRTNSLRIISTYGPRRMRIFDTDR